jgi:hypothetical protein
LIVLEVKTLYKVWFGSLVDYSKLRVFNCLDNAHFKKDKFGSRVRKYEFLSYTYMVRGIGCGVLILNHLSLLLTRIYDL